MPLDFTSAELKCRDLYIKLAEEEGVSTAESTNTIKAEEKCMAMREVIFPYQYPVFCT